MGDGHQHDIRRMLPTIGAVLAFILACVFNGLAASGSNAIFHNTTSAISNKYETEVTPSGWTFSIWGIIYFWQALWLLYGVSLLFRKGPDGYLYLTEDIIPTPIYILYIINMVANITWIILWDREEMIAALIVILIMAGTSFMFISLSVRQLVIIKSKLIQDGLSREIILIIALVHNGLAIYDTWLDIATFVNLTIVMAYDGNLSVEDASTIGLVLILLLVLSWFLLDVILLDAFTRWVLTPYFVFCFALAGIIDKNDDGGRNATFAVVMEAFAVFFAICKVALSSWRQLKGPLPIDTVLERKQIFAVGPTTYT